jgi:hypothetical protein
VEPAAAAEPSPLLQSQTILPGREACWFAEQSEANRVVSHERENPEPREVLLNYSAKSDFGSKMLCFPAQCKSARYPGRNRRFAAGQGGDRCSAAEARPSASSHMRVVLCDRKHRLEMLDVDARSL